MATKNQITGGAFQDSLGNLVANGYMTFELSQDVQVNSNTQIGAGRITTITLDASGNVAGTQSVWPNDLLLPAGSFYLVSVYTAQGQLVWGPNAQQVLSTPSPFNIGAWVPASVNVNTSGGGGGAGTVTSVSVATANGVSGTVASPTTTPVITLSLAGFLAQTNSWTATQDFADVALVSGTPATNVANQDSPSLLVVGNFWNGSASAQDTWTVLNTLGTGTNPSSSLTLSHSGTPGNAQFEVPNINVAGNTNTGTLSTTAGAQIGGTFAMLSLAVLDAPNASSTSGNMAAPDFRHVNQFWNGTASQADEWNWICTIGSGTTPTTTLTLSHATGTSGAANFHVPNINLDAATLASTASSGSATLPSNPLGFVEMVVNSTTVKIPYYAV